MLGKQPTEEVGDQRLLQTLRVMQTLEQEETAEEQDLRGLARHQPHHDTSVLQGAKRGDRSSRSRADGRSRNEIERTDTLGDGGGSDRTHHTAVRPFQGQADALGDRINGPPGQKSRSQDEVGIAAQYVLLVSGECRVRVGPERSHTDDLGEGAE